MSAKSALMSLWKLMGAVYIKFGILRLIHEKTLEPPMKGVSAPNILVF